MHACCTRSHVSFMTRRSGSVIPLDASAGTALSRVANGSPASRKHRAALIRALEDGPMPATHGVVRWRLIDLCQWMWEEFRVSIAKPTFSRELRALGYRKLTARPRHHAQAEGAIEAFKKTYPRAWRKSRASRASNATT
jgi:Winged helix-turn helix